MFAVGHQVPFPHIPQRRAPQDRRIGTDGKVRLGVSESRLSPTPLPPRENKDEQLLGLHGLKMHCHRFQNCGSRCDVTVALQEKNVFREFRNVS